ncbi:MAG: NAD(P)-binding domain-containing protein [Rhodobacteraceae bacterium]|nr:NAD(P)-binding domain-containing protein [Paracoccaceae bacterium]
MSVEKVDTLVVGAGQAGIAASEHLTRNGIPHLVLERARIAERWRSERWDSLVANGPAWHDRFPGMTFTGDPDAFVGKEGVADYFVDYAKKFNAPVRTGVAVTSVTRNPAGPGFVVETSEGTIQAARVIAATGPFQKPVIPALIPETPGLTQMHSTAYRNPAALPPGGVLVVGAGSSGAQIAEELLQSGRKVWLSVGPHGRPPRAYRGRDFVWWLGVLNKWDSEATPGAEHTTIAVSGARGGRTVDFRRFAAEGMNLLGRTQSFADGSLTFAPDLAANIAQGDANYLSVLDEADAWVARNGLALPEEPAARDILPDPACMTHPVLSLNLAAEGITTVIWATGFAVDFSWLKTNAVDEAGRPRHLRGIGAEPGIYFLGQPYQTRRGSSFIWGVWHDAKLVADHIAIQRSYLAYDGPGTPAA